jgi:2-oxoglutarate ferredoxin oxidoreductase subunit gamma
MTEEIIIAGFGGQGILSMGKILAYSGIMQEQEVSWMPSYGPEMRGGTANVTVILSDDRVSSPVLQSYDTAILLNQQSVDKFEPMVKPGGLMLYDPNGITRHPDREDIRIFQVEAAEEAARLKSPITFNMIVLGAYIKINPVVDYENVIKGLRNSLPARHHHHIPKNEVAIQRGMELVHEARLAL